MSTAEQSSPITTVAENEPIIRRPHHERWISAVLVVAAVVWVIVGLASNDKLQWDVFARYVFSSRILEGLWITIQLTLISMTIAIVIGFAMAAMARSSNAVLRIVAKAYIGFFRGLPLLVLLLVTFNLALFMPTITIGIPGIIGPTYDTNTLISGFTASIIGLALHESAFMAEIVRGGLLAVPKGQVEAAMSVGMPRRTVMAKIVYPQAVRLIIPVTGNQLIMLIKASSMVAVIGGGELLTIAQRIYGQNFAVVPLLLVVSFWYLVLVLLASLGQSWLERRLGRSVAGLPVKRTIPKEVAL